MDEFITLGKHIREYHNNKKYKEDFDKAENKIKFIKTWFQKPTEKEK